MNPMQKAYHKPFNWETNNCGLMVANYYKERFGATFGSEFEGNKTAYQFYRTLAKHGGFEELLKKNGFTKVGYFCKKGDVGIVRIGKHKTEALGLINEDKIVTAGGNTFPLTQTEGRIFRHNTYK